MLTRSSYLMHANSSRQMYVDFNANKKFDIETMIYYVKFIIWDEKEYFFKKFIELIMFFSKFLIATKTRYWSTKLKIVDIIWVLRKIKHLIDFFAIKSIVVFTNYDAILKIAKQISMTTTSIDKLNLRLVRASNYIQRFELKFRYKLEKQYVVSNALSRLSNNNIFLLFENDELNVLFTIVLINMKKDFLKKIVDEYRINLN